MLCPSPRLARPRARLHGGTVIDLPGPEEDVVLPVVGQLFKVLGAIQDPADRKYNRRSVVVGVPRDLNGRIRIVTRTTDEERKGVASPKDVSLGFDQPGVWGHYRSVDARLWVRPDVVCFGVLDAAALAEICKHFDLRGTVS